MSFEQAALYEHRFWLQVLGDHARFIRDSLAPGEAEDIQRAGTFVQVYDQLLQVAREPLGGAALRDLGPMVYRHTLELRNFKLHLLRKHLSGQLAIHLTPTFINHMVNELDEYIRVLTFLQAERTPEFDAFHHHLLWLPDASGHAAAIGANLDQVEMRLRERSRHFETTFAHFYLKAVEMAGFLRTQLDDFPALRRFNEQVEIELGLFRQFIHDLEQMKLTNVLLATLMPLMADHMAREECYYLTKLSQAGAAALPGCDATAPRIRA
jgi:Protein of unknown function (DUF2935).